MSAPLRDRAARSSRDDRSSSRSARARRPWRGRPAPGGRGPRLPRRARVAAACGRRSRRSSPSLSLRVAIRTTATSGILSGSKVYASASDPADVPGSGEVAHRAPVELLAALGLAAALVSAWLIADPRTPDLAAQVYRVSLFEHDGLALWDVRWYGGHALPGYS